MTSGIYKITNLEDGSIYVGQSKNIEKRFKQHQSPKEWEKRGHNKILYNAFRKYGVENFTFEILECCENKQQMNELEKKWIQYYHCYIYDELYQRGYNMTPGGDGRDPAELREWWKNIDASKKQKIINSSAKARTGSTLSDETKKLIGEKQRAFRQMHPYTEQDKYNIAMSMSNYTVIAYDKNHNVVGKFPSIHYVLSNFLHFSSCSVNSYNALQKSIQNNTLYHGYYWSIVDDKI